MRHLIYFAGMLVCMISISGCKHPAYGYLPKPDNNATIEVLVVAADGQKIPGARVVSTGKALTAYIEGVTNNQGVARLIVRRDMWGSKIRLTVIIEDSGTHTMCNIKDRSIEVHKIIVTVDTEHPGWRTQL